jgi:hypothetical protein
LEKEAAAEDQHLAKEAAAAEKAATKGLAKEIAAEEQRLAKEAAKATNAEKVAKKKRKLAEKSASIVLKKQKGRLPS